MRAKGAVQVFDWLKVEDNLEYSSMTYHNPLNVGEGGGIWRNIADEGHILQIKKLDQEEDEEDDW